MVLGMPKPAIGVVGLGYVGLTTATVLANYDYEVIGVDLDSKKIQTINKGEAPIDEPGLSKLLDQALNTGKFIATTEYEKLRDSEIIFITVGTPPRSDGSANLTQVFTVAKKLGKLLKNTYGEYPLVVLKSTVPPGTTRRIAQVIEDEGIKVGKDFGTVSNPEFLREGQAVKDTLSPSRIVIGEIDERGASILEDFWMKFYNTTGYKPTILRVTAETAEMIKYASNAFLATKISFANMLARLCEKIPECDIVDVVKGMGLDPRINPAYLGAGLGYGGSCFPKDVKALARLAEQLCIDASLLEAVERINETQPLYIVNRLEQILTNLEGKTITILGAAFKPETDDTRESRSLKLSLLLVERGAKVKLHDPNPKALANARETLGDQVEYHYDIKSALQEADAAVIATEWKQYKELQPSHFTNYMKKPVIIDARRVYNPHILSKFGIKYYAIGKGGKTND